MEATSWPYNVIGKAIRALREDAGLTQDALSQRVGLTRTSISNIENGSQKILVHSLYDLAEASGVPPESLLPPPQGRKGTPGNEAKYLDKLSTQEKAWVNAIMFSKPVMGNNKERSKGTLKAPPKPADILLTIPITRPPIPVDRVAKRYGAVIRGVPSEEAISGLLFISENEIIIGVNSLHSRARQRFAIAHEIGHLALHPDKSFRLEREFGELHHTKGRWQSNSEESEANNFALHLLIPSVMLEDDLRNRPIDYEDTEKLSKLAERYQVSIQAMTRRLAQV